MGMLFDKQETPVESKTTSLAAAVLEKGQEESVDEWDAIESTARPSTDSGTESEGYHDAPF
jgi:hypothetical protein